jgi:glycine reductase
VNLPLSISTSPGPEWATYAFSDRSNPSSGWRSLHAGFDTRWVAADPNRVLPLDAARKIAGAGVIGALHDRYYVTVGVGTTAEHARRFGREIAAELTRDGVAAAVMTAT